MGKTVRWIACGVLSLPAIILCYFAWSRPDDFSRIFLRSGGRIVRKMVDRPARVAAFLAVSVIMLWIVIAIRCAWEAWRERRKQIGDVPRSVAKRRRQR